jgi:hypothetical protein
VLNTGPPSTWILAGVGRGIVLVNADEVMWQFFRRFSVPAPPPVPFIDTTLGFPGIRGSLLSGG